MLNNIPLKTPPVEVKLSTIHGYGVFAARTINAGEIIEECPVLVVKKADLDLLNYWFRWQETPEAGSRSALALGYGSLYNHSSESNAEFVCDYPRQLIVIKAKKTIPIGEEILVYYADGWLELRGIKETKPRTQFQDTVFLLLKIGVMVGVILLIKFLLTLKL